MENLDALQLQEIKVLCKNYNISTIGDKKSLIKKLKYYLEPIPNVLNTHTGRKVPKNKEVVGAKVDSTQEINSLLKRKGQFLYYSLGYSYYSVDKLDK